jgi:hypothetical protein
MPRKRRARSSLAGSTIHAEFAPPRGRRRERVSRQRCPAAPQCLAACTGDAGFMRNLSARIIRTPPGARFRHASSTAAPGPAQPPGRPACLPARGPGDRQGRSLSSAGVAAPCVRRSSWARFLASPPGWTLPRFASFRSFVAILALIVGSRCASGSSDPFCKAHAHGKAAASASTPFRAQ